MDSITTRCDRQRDARPRAAAAALLFGGVTLTGCGRGLSPLSPVERDRMDRADEWRARLTPLERTAGPERASPDLGEPRTPQEYERLALERNPSIRAASARVRRLRERAPQARSLDDPMLVVVPVGDMAQTAAGQVSVMSSVSQRLPLPGKLDARGKIADLDAAQAEAELQQARLQVTADTRRAYWAYYYASAAATTTAESRDLLVQFRDVADAQFRAGQRKQEDVLRAAAELGNLDAELAVLAQRRDGAAAMLRQLIDAPPSFLLPAPEPPAQAEVMLNRDRLFADAVRDNPGLLRASERIAQFAEQQRLANLNRWPDLTLSLTYNWVNQSGISPVANGDDQWWIGFGFNLPIWGEKNDAAEREAIFGRLEAASELANERNRVVFRVDDALLRLDSQRAVVRLLHDRVVPDARAAVEASASTYRTGAGDFLTLVDNWRKLLNYRVMEDQAVAAVGQALADLQLAIGADLDAGGAAPTADAPPKPLGPVDPRNTEPER